MHDLSIVVVRGLLQLPLLPLSSVVGQKLDNNHQIVYLSVSAILTSTSIVNENLQVNNNKKKLMTPNETLCPSSDKAHITEIEETSTTGAASFKNEILALEVIPYSAQ